MGKLVILIGYFFQSQRDVEFKIHFFIKAQLIYNSHSHTVLISFFSRFSLAERFRVLSLILPSFLFTPYLLFSVFLQKWKRKNV